MVRVKNCAICHNCILLDFDQQKKDGVCPRCGATFQYRLLGRRMFEVICDRFPAADEEMLSVQCG